MSRGHAAGSAFVLAVLACGACSVDAEVSGGGGAAGRGSTGGGGAHGGAGGSGGADGSAGGSRVDAGPAYTVSPCPGTAPSPGLTSTFPPCTTVCGAPAHCVPLAYVGTRSGTLPGCSEAGTTGKCVPDPISETQGNFVFTKCTFFLTGKEGRCVPRCILAARSSQAPFLSQDVCGTEERCAPCTDPTNGDAPTGACDDFCASPGADAGSDASPDASLDSGDRG